jgi:hypothetical protein
MTGPGGGGGGVFYDSHGEMYGAALYIEQTGCHSYHARSHLHMVREHELQDAVILINERLDVLVCLNAGVTQGGSNAVLVGPDVLGVGVAG